MAALLFVVRLDEIDIRLLYLAEAFGHVFEKCRIPWLGIEMLSQVFGTERVAVASHDLVTHQPQLFAVHAGEVFLGEETVGGLRIVAGGFLCIRRLDKAPCASCGTCRCGF